MVLTLKQSLFLCATGSSSPLLMGGDEVGGGLPSVIPPLFHHFGLLLWTAYNPLYFNNCDGGLGLLLTSSWVFSVPQTQLEELVTCSENSTHCTHTLGLLQMKTDPPSHQ